MAAPIKSFWKNEVQLAVWRNENSGKESITIQRSWKDKKTQKWDRSPFFSEKDLTTIRELMNQYYTWKDPNHVVDEVGKQGVQITDDSDGASTGIPQGTVITD